MGQMAKRAPALIDTGRLFDSAFSVLRVDCEARLQAALIFSFVVHLIIIVGVTVQAPERNSRSRSPDLQVELVNARTLKAADKPEILAQHNLDGGGNTDADRRAKTPLPVTRQSPETDISLKMRRAETRESEPTRVMTQRRDSAPSVATPDARPKADPQPESPPVPSASDIVNSSREMIQLQGQISRSLEEYNKRPRRTFIGARAKEFRFASYLDAWRQRIERIGELNYPAAGRGIYGTLLVTVEIRVDGGLEKVEINRSSGHKVLDQAAIDIVRLAAPFAALPPDIARDTDILSITHTWTFTRSDRFQAE